MYTKDQLKKMNRLISDNIRHRQASETLREGKFTGNLNKDINAELWRMNKSKLYSKMPRVKSNEPKGKVLQEIEKSVELLQSSVDTLPSHRLPIILSDKVKEYNKAVKEKNLDSYVSSDLLTLMRKKDELIRLK